MGAGQHDDAVRSLVDGREEDPTNLDMRELLADLYRQSEDWEALVEWLETNEDIKIAGNAAAELEAAGGDRQRAGWLRWEDPDLS